MKVFRVMHAGSVWPSDFLSPMLAWEEIERRAPDAFACNFKVFSVWIETADYRGPSLDDILKQTAAEVESGVDVLMVKSGRLKLGRPKGSRSRSRREPEAAPVYTTKARSRITALTAPRIQAAWLHGRDPRTGKSWELADLAVAFNVSYASAKKLLRTPMEGDSR